MRVCWVDLVETSKSGEKTASSEEKVYISAWYEQSTADSLPVWPYHQISQGDVDTKPPSHKATMPGTIIDPSTKQREVLFTKPLLSSGAKKRRGKSLVETTQGIGGQLRRDRLNNFKMSTVS